MTKPTKVFFWRAVLAAHLVLCFAVLGPFIALAFLLELASKAALWGSDWLDKNLGRVHSASGADWMLKKLKEAKLSDD